MRDVSLPIKSEAVIINDLLEVRSFDADPRVAWGTLEWVVRWMNNYDHLSSCLRRRLNSTMSVIEYDWENMTWKYFEKIFEKFWRKFETSWQLWWQIGKNVFKHVSLCQLSLPVLVPKIWDGAPRKNSWGFCIVERFSQLKEEICRLSGLKFS